MLRIAYFSPLPPQRTGIAGYSADLLPHLGQHADLTLFIEDPASVSQDLKDRFVVRKHDDFSSRRWRYDMAVYQMGNSPSFHRGAYEILRRYPGLTVLHDTTLHHSVVRTTLEEGDFPAYARELGYARGSEGIALAHAVRRGAREYPLREWPLSQRAVDLSVGVLVHSDYARRKILALQPRGWVRKVGQPIPLPCFRAQAAARTRLQLPRGAFVIITCGFVIPDKRLDVVLEGFARFRHRHPDALWLVVGEMLSGYRGFDEAVDRLKLGGAVRRIGYVPGLNAFYDYIAASDVCVNLRCPTAGETSASVLRAMAMGRPVTVSNLGWYAELPDDCCARINHDGTEAEQLVSILDRWYDHPGAREATGRRARRYVAREFDPTHVAQQYFVSVKRLLGDLSARPGGRQTVGRAAGAALGIRKRA
jgi:glycosyltransferase involved in cell wall biosynthesis